VKTPSINRDADVKQGIVDTGEELLTRVESIVWATVRQGNTTPAAMLRELNARPQTSYVAGIRGEGLYVGMDVLQRATDNVRVQLQSAVEDLHKDRRSEPVASNPPPDRIWLQWWDTNGEHDEEGITWCADQINDSDVLYVRAMDEEIDNA